MEMSAQDIQYVIGPEGQPTAVLVDIAMWERKKAGFISWASF